MEKQPSDIKQAFSQQSEDLVSVQGAKTEFNDFPTEAELTSIVKPTATYQAYLQITQSKKYDVRKGGSGTQGRTAQDYLSLTKSPSTLSPAAAFEGLSPNDFFTDAEYQETIAPRFENYVFQFEFIPSGLPQTFRRESLNRIITNNLLLHLGDLLKSDSVVSSGSNEEYLQALAGKLTPQEIIKQWNQGAVGNQGVWAIGQKLLLEYTKGQLGENQITKLLAVLRVAMQQGVRDDTSQIRQDVLWKSSRLKSSPSWLLRSMLKLMVR